LKNPKLRKRGFVTQKKRRKRSVYKLRDEDDFKIWRWRYSSVKKTTNRGAWDNSNLQYIYLGLKAAVRVGIKFESNDLWYGSLLHWLETQEQKGPEVEVWAPLDTRSKKQQQHDPYGFMEKKDPTFKSQGKAMARGWGYGGFWRGKGVDHHGDPNVSPEAKTTLTSAGISSMLLIRSVLFNENDYLAYFEDATEDAITDGFSWMAHRWSSYVSKPSSHTSHWDAYYSYYGVERVGVYAGTEFIGISHCTPHCDPAS